MKHITLTLVLSLLASSSNLVAQAEKESQQLTLSPPAIEMKGQGKGYKHTDRKKNRYTVKTKISDRGSTVPVETKDIIRLCSDTDGCSLRLGMYNFDSAGRVASREALFFYNKVNHTWRASLNDTAGTDFNGVTEHVLSAWSCYFTDGVYKDWQNKQDSEIGFGLLSWKPHTAECWLTIID